MILAAGRRVCPVRQRHDTPGPGALAVALLLMAIISTFLLIWAKRRGWW